MTSDFATPRRQHPLGMLVLAVKFTWKVIQSAWPALVGLSLADAQWYHLLGIPVILGLIGAFAVVYYLRFHFHVASDALIVERGLFQRERLQIPFERIQAVQLFQGPVQQLVGLTGLRVDTAGSSGSELELVAIRKQDAEGLQLLLRSQMASPESATADPLSGEAPTAAEMAPMVELSFADLMKVGLTQNHIKNAFIGFAVVMSLFQGFEDRLSLWLAGLPPLVLTVLGMATVLLIVPGLIMMAVVGVVTSLIGAALNFWKLKSAIGAEGVQLEMGLLRRNVFEVPFDKVHLTEWKSNWLRRKFGYETLRIRQAQAAGAGGLRVFIPAMEPRHRAAMEAAVYPDIAQGVLAEARPAGRLRWLLFAGAILPALAVLISPSISHAILGLCWGAFVFWTTGRRFAAYRMAVHSNAIVLESGWFWRSRTVLKMGQLQGVEWRRNALLERRGIGHLVFHTAAGARSFGYMHKEQGLRILDFAINQLHSASLSAPQPAA